MFQWLDVDSVGGLRGSGPPTLNWLFLVECIVVIILTLFYFFYFNRLMGLLASWIFRILFWRSSNSHFEFGGLQISVLGGRIQFNDFRYISRNQSLRILSGKLAFFPHQVKNMLTKPALAGHITWKYWLRRVRSEEDKASVSLQGAEWFLYNRTPAYDSILEQLGVRSPFDRPPSPDSTESSSSDSKDKDGNTADRASVLTGSAAIEQEQWKKDEKEREKRRMERKGKSRTTDWLREALPIQVRCKKGAITMGNPSTPSILIAGFDGVEGTYAAISSRSQLDEYKQVYHFTFAQPKIVWRTNPDYEEGMADHGRTVLDRIEKEARNFSVSDLFLHPTRFLTLQGFHALLRGLPRRGRRARLRAEREEAAAAANKLASPSWTGLPRYQAHEDPASEKSYSPPHPVEYAKVTTLLTSPEIEMTYYCDTAGLVPDEPRMVPGLAGLETHDVGNGDLSPEWGVDLVVRGGMITYGPWADRQRAKLQSAFTPATYFNGLQTPRLRPGDQRMHTALKVFVEFIEGATLRDWKYDAVDGASLGERVVRPYGWLDVTLGPNSTLTYVLPMVATKAGYDTLLEVHLDELSITSSVNYAQFFYAETCRIHCSLPAPLVWDERRTWAINTILSKPDMALLRDHITLFSDVAKDWTSGVPGDYDHFVPFLYEMIIDVRDYNIRLFVNDHNIINNPTAYEDNTLLILSGPKLGARVAIPSDEYRMECSNITFGVNFEDIALSMSLPDWNTHSAFLTERTSTFAAAPEINLNGAYRFYSRAHPDNVEKLDLHIDARDVVFTAIGWMIRHMFNLKDNYFGTFLHFVTLEEYRHRYERNLQGDPIEAKYRPGKTDVFEVSLTFQLENGILLLPQEIYDCRAAVALVLPQLQVDLRNHDYFMEMSLNVDPFRIIETADSVALSGMDFAQLWEQRTDLIRVQGLEIGAHRLFGPQPRTATYMCIWSFYIGTIVGSVPPSFLQALSRAGSAVATTFADGDNALAPDFTVPLDPDATFLTVDIHSIDLAIRGQATAIQLYLSEGIDLRFDDLASAPFLKHISIDVPTLTLRALAPLFGRAAPWMEVASLDADLSIVLGMTTSGWEDRARQQLAFIAQQDSLTKRCPFVYGQGPGSSSHAGNLFLPALENPLQHEGRHSHVDDGHPWSIRDDVSDDDSDTSVDASSDTSDGHFDDVYSRFKGRDQAGDRFSAYGAILRLCERAPEAAFIDRPTFRRLPRAAGETDTLNAVAVQVGADVLDGLAFDTDFERCLDDLYTGYLAAQNALLVLRFSELSVQANLPMVSIELIQDVLRPEDTISLRQGDNKKEDERMNATVLCTVQLTLSDIAFAYRELNDGFGGVELPTAAMPTIIVERAASASAGTTRLEVFHPEQSNLASTRQNHTLFSTPGSARARPTALDLIFERSEARVDFTSSRGVVSLVGGAARLDFVDEAAELIVGTVWSWRVVNDIITPLKKREADRKALLQHLVWSIIETTEAASLTSFPTFLNRVSYLVGASTTLRSDDGWKIIHCLRHCLRLAKPQVERVFNERRTWPSPAELRSNLLDTLQRRHSWDIDVADIAHSAFLTTLYGASADGDLATPQGGSSGFSWTVPLAVECKTGRFDAVFHNGGAASNRLAVGPFESFATSTGFDEDSEQFRIRAKFTLSSLEGWIDRDLLVLIRHIVRVRHTFERKIKRYHREVASSVVIAPVDTPNSSALLDVWSTLPVVVVEASFGISRLAAHSRADNLEAQAVIYNAATSAFARIEPVFGSKGLLDSHRADANCSFTIGKASFSAREPAAAETVGQGVLLSTDIDGIASIATATGVRHRDGVVQVEMATILQAFEAIRIRLPRDAIKAYEFVENWKISSLPVYDSLLTELRQGLDDSASTNEDEDEKESSTSSQPPVPSQPFASTQFRAQLMVPLISLEIQAIPSLKAGYSVQHLSAYAHSSGTPQQDHTFGEIAAGLHIGSQTVRFIPLLAATAGAPVLPSETAFDLPVIRLKARVDGLPARRVTALAAVDSVSVRLTASILDHILTVQEHFGNDLDEFLRVLRSKKAAQAAGQPRLSTPAPSISKPATTAAAIEWDARIALRGFKVALEGPQATQWVEAELIEALASSTGETASQRLHWQASVQNLALSLAQRAPEDTSPTLGSASDRRYRLAFFRLDLSAGNAVISLPELPSLSSSIDADTPHLHIRLPRIHAVMQPIAIEALGDLVDHFAGEIQDRRKSRKSEVEALQSRVIQTLDMSEDDQTARSWLSSCVLSLEAQSVGLAIPLSDEGVSGMAAGRRRRLKPGQSRPAFLVSLSSVKFAAQKGSAGFARISRFAAQFVADFDQGRKEDFDGDVHQSLNRVLLPDMQCTLRSPSNSTVLVHSQVSGLEIDVEPSVVAYSFSLIDIYRLSHDRFAKFASETTVASLNCPDSSRSRSRSAPPTIVPPSGSATSVSASFEFATGVIRMHSDAEAKKAAASPPHGPAARPKAHRRGKSLSDFASLRLSSGRTAAATDPPADVFRLPALSLWAEYRGDDNAYADSQLHVDMVIHKSNNTLYPTLLPFVSSVVHRIQERAFDSPTAMPSSTTAVPARSSMSAPAPAAIAPPVVGHLKLGISLKIDQSRLEISCLPAAEVTARLTWESGGFLLNFSPEAKGFDFALAVDGVAAGLRHSFSPEDCLLAEAKGLAASVSFAAAPDDKSPGVLSVVVNAPDMSGEMNFRHLQDWLCLKAVWLDRIDLGPATMAPEQRKAPAPTAPAPVSATNVTSIVRVELGTLRFMCDLGPSIGRLTLLASEVAARLRWVPGDSRFFSTSLKKLEISGQGRAGGLVELDGIRFATMLRDDGQGAPSASDLLRIDIALGRIDAAVEYEFHRILVLQADPIEVSVDDDWSRASEDDPALDLSFRVKMGSFNIIGTTATIPTLVGVSQRVQVLIDEKAAQADATIKGAGLQPRPTSTDKAENAISAVASKFGKDSSGPADCPVRIVNRLWIQIDRIRIAIFPEHWNDGEIFRFDGGSTIRAQLVRGVDANQQIQRQLQLFLGFFSVRKVTHRKVSPSQESEYTVVQWYELFRTSSERNIFKIGTTEVKMDSEQAVGSYRLKHKFSMKFGGHVDVALNYALLRNLSSLASQYQMQMERASSTKNGAFSPSTHLTSDPTAPLVVPPAVPDVATTTISEDDIPKREGDVITMKPMPLVQARTGERKALEFEAVQMDVHQPQLQVLGDATPPLEWLGLQRDRFPAFIHTGVTSPLEELLVSLSAIYGTQLARSKLNKRQGAKPSTSSA
ncbi:hypothetical protein JCM21900_000512 [Sporobolomyces salmonicolor]